MMIKQEFQLVGTTDQMLKKYVGISATVFSSSSPVSIVIALDDKDLEGLIEYMATIGWIPV